MTAASWVRSLHGPGHQGRECGLRAQGSVPAKRSPWPGSSLSQGSVPGLGGLLFDPRWQEKIDTYCIPSRLVCALDCCEPFSCLVSISHSTFAYSAAWKRSFLLFETISLT